MLTRRQRLLANNFGGNRAPIITVSAVWTDNGDGTATVTFTTDFACYGGVDYGTVSGTLTSSAFNYDGAGPALELATAHTVPIPDAVAGGTETPGTFYFRIWAAIGTFSGYITAESSGVITNAQAIGLEGSLDEWLMESGDLILMESGSETDVSALTAASTLGGTEDIAGVQGGNSRRITPTQIKTYVNA